MRENSSSSSAARPTGLRPAELVQLAQHHQVLPAGEQRVDGGVLGGQADAAADLGGLGADVEAGDGGLALVGARSGW